MAILILLVGIIVSGACAGVMYALLGQIRKGSEDLIAALKNERNLKVGYAEKIRTLYSGLIESKYLISKVKEYKSSEDALKAEKGRITITQAELETVEARLRDLEELERELEASNSETQEELGILKKKEKELRGKNDALKAQIAASNKKTDDLLGQLEMSTEMRERVTGMQSELIRTEEKLSDLLSKIELCNEQYIHLKMRYDALDIEYAQLYERFADAEQSAPKDEE